MSSLKADFDELLERLRQGRAFGHASFEPVYYLVFHPRKILEVKRELPALTARLHNHGWQVQRFSIAEEIAALLGTAPLRQIWLAADRQQPLDWQRTNESLANYLSRGALLERVRSRLDALKGNPHALLLVTDLEALHPYLRIGSIEGKLVGSFAVPTVFLYPGIRTGKSQLKFLGFYNEDGNYRSVHIGGFAAP
jgi:hypothetical protein